MDKYELVKDDGDWKLRQPGAQRAIRAFETKEAGMGFSTDYVKSHGGSLRIKLASGTYQEERTYPRSADPRRSKG